MTGEDDLNTDGLRFDIDMFEAGFTPTPNQLQRLRDACDEIDRLRIAAQLPLRGRTTTGESIPFPFPVHNLVRIVRFWYTNREDEHEMRTVVPVRIWFGSTGWHPTLQWLLSGYDVDRGINRDFALDKITGWAAHNPGSPLKYPDEIDRLREDPNNLTRDADDADVPVPLTVDPALLSPEIRSYTPTRKDPGRVAGDDDSWFSWSNPTPRRTSWWVRFLRRQ